MKARGVAAASATLAVAAVLVLPYCNVLFDCGCGWPWAGLTQHCNIHSQRSAVHCPWCQHPLAGTASILLAALFGAVVAFRGDARSRAEAGGKAGKGGTSRPRSPRVDVVVRTLAGVGAFLLAALAAGWLTALLTGYPKFVFR